MKTQNPNLAFVNKLLYVLVDSNNKGTCQGCAGNTDSYDNSVCSSLNANMEFRGIDGCSNHSENKIWKLVG